MHVQRDEDGRIVGAGGEGAGEDQEQDDTDAAAESALLPFSSPREAATIAAFLRTRVYRPESLVWLEGCQALLRWRAENEVTGLYAVAYDTGTEVGVTKDFPLGRWVHRQRKALRAGELEPRRKEPLDAQPRSAPTTGQPGTSRPGRERCGATARQWCRSDSTWPTPDGKNGLGKDPERVAERAAQLTAIAPDRDCPWPLDWQRHYRVLANLVDADGSLLEIQPGVLMDGDDIGKWLQQQKQPAPGRDSCPSSRSGCPRWASSRWMRRLRPGGRSYGEAPEQGAAGVPARPRGPRAVGGTGSRPPACTARPQ